jgi:hypothetical protein
MDSRAILDSRWTPRNRHRFGGSVLILLGHYRFGSSIALTRAVDPPFQCCLNNHETTFTCLYRKSPMDYHRSDVRT